MCVCFLGAVRVGMVDGQLLINPTRAEMTASSLNLIVVGAPCSQVGKFMLANNVQKNHKTTDVYLLVKQEASNNLNSHLAMHQLLLHVHVCHYAISYSY